MKHDMANMHAADPILPQYQQLPVEEVAFLSVSHPEHDRSFLFFGCRTRCGTSRAISRLLVQQAATLVAQTEGFLSLSQDRAAEGISDDDALIQANRYYFHATDPAFADYGLCGDFDAWEPPAGPDALPEPWRTLAKAYNEVEISPPQPFWDDSIADWVTKTDGYCALTGNPDLVQCQNVVPRQHANWAGMYNIVERATKSGFRLPYAVLRVIDDIRGLITMNPFARDLMDAGLFAPFPLTAADGSTEFVAYFLSPDATASGVDYHCRALTIPPRVSPYLLYIRFAWTIINFFVYSETGFDIVRKPLPAWAMKKRKRDVSNTGADPESNESWEQDDEDIINS